MVKHFTETCIMENIFVQILQQVGFPCLWSNKSLTLQSGGRIGKNLAEEIDKIGKDKESARLKQEHYFLKQKMSYVHI